MFTILNFRIWITLLLASSVLGCGGGGTAAPAPGDSGAAETVAESPAALTTGWPTPARITAAAGEHLPEQPGADFDAALPVSNCTPATGKAIFDPAWMDGARQLSNAAYALYRLQLNPAGPSATLYLEWAGAAPGSDDCWLGLADIANNRWRWVSLPQSGEVVLTNPADYAGAGDAAFVAVLLLGDTPAELVRIGYGAASPELTYPIVDTMQNTSHDDTGMQITPEPGEAFYGQDAQYNGNQASYTDNGDGTITDNVTGLMWAKTPNNMEKCTFAEAFTIAASLDLAGYDDWRVPTIKELYSLIDFRGVTGMTEFESTPYIDTGYFDFEYGDESAGERIIDAQYWSSTEYVSTTMGGSPTTFGVNFADGRIKGYGRENPQGPEMEQFIRCVRGNPDYGANDFVDNGDGTITDTATGLMWLKDDSGAFGVGDESDGKLNWEQALAWAEGLEYGGYDDWRLPTTKELQSIVDYTRSPDTTDSPALDPVFDSTSILDEEGDVDWAHYWTNTSHFDGAPERLGDRGCYVAFGEGQGYMEMPPDSGNYVFLDVHGAGCQRSDPKSGNPDEFPVGFGPQGDVQRIYNMVRPVRTYQSVE